MYQILTLFILFAFPFVVTGQIIDEIQFNSPGTDDEWIEICNDDADNELDIANFVLLVGSDVMLTFPSDAAIPAGGCITVGLGDDGDDTDSFNNECPFIPTYVRDGLVINGSTANTNILPNSRSEDIILQDANGSIVDQVNYDPSHLDGGSQSDGKTFTLGLLSEDNANTSEVQYPWVASQDPGGSPNLPANSLCPSSQTTLLFSTTAGSADESAGTLNATVCVRINRPSFDNPTSVEVAITGGSATNGTDIENIDSPITLFYDAGSFRTQCIEIVIIEDEDTEGLEVIQFELQNPMGGRNMATIGDNATFDLTIVDNDFTSAYINEVLYAPFAADDEREFFEIRGEPNQSLAGIWLIEVDGDGNRAGSINRELDLSSYSLGSNGLLLVRDEGAPYTPAPDPETTFVSIQAGTGLFQNGTSTFLLVTSQNTSINDIDTDNDGVVDVTSWDMLLDAVAVTDGGTDDRMYAAALGGTNLPRHQGATTAHGVFRGEGNNWFAATSQAGDSGDYEFDFDIVWDAADNPIPANTLTPPQFTPGTIGQAILSIKAVNFWANFQEGYPMLEWRVIATPTPTDFKLYRVANDQPPVLLQSWDHAATQDAYQYIDRTPHNGINQYQLEWHVEGSGLPYRQMITLPYSNADAQVAVYPTVTTDNVQLFNAVPGTVVVLLDQLGSVVSQLVTTDANTQISLPQKGIYYLRIQQQLIKLVRI